jgi:phage I-like protein
MTTLRAALFSALSDATPPEWVQIMPAGTFRGRDGRGPYRLADAGAVIAASMEEAGGRLPIDENHAIDLAAPRGGPSPAVGWIVALEARADGIWGRVEWLDAGRDLIAGKRYRGLSPVFLHDKSGTVRRIERAALTNLPNLPIRTLHATTETDPMDFIVKLRAALGLAEDADEAAILAAVEAAVAAKGAAPAMMARLAAAAGLKADADEPALTAALQAHAGAADTVKALQTQLDSLTADIAKERAVAAVDAAIAAGKPLSPRRDAWIARHVADPAGTKADIAALPSINDGGIVVPPAPGKGGLDADQKALCAHLGITEDAFKTAMNAN